MSRHSCCYRAGLPPTANPLFPPRCRRLLVLLVPLMLHSACVPDRSLRSYDACQESSTDAMCGSSSHSATYEMPSHSFSCSSCP